MTTKTYESTARIFACELLIEAGTEHAFTDFENAKPTALTVHPGPGATATVYLTTSLPSKVALGAARWLPAGIGTAGVVSSPAGMVLDAPATGIKIVATGGRVAVEIVQ